MLALGKREKKKVGGWGAEVVWMCLSARLAAKTPSESRKVARHQRSPFVTSKKVEACF